MCRDASIPLIGKRYGQSINATPCKSRTGRVIHLRVPRLSSRNKFERHHSLPGLIKPNDTEGFTGGSHQISPESAVTFAGVPEAQSISCRRSDRKRPMRLGTAEGRERIAAAQRKRWAKQP